MSTILLVEDNPDIMKINYMALMMEGYTILKAETVAECMDVLEKSVVDIIVLDVMLPDGNGIDLCAKIKRRFDIPIIFLSALGENSDIIAALRAGGDSYLSKPYDINVLIAQVEAGLRTSQRGKQVFSVGDLSFDTVALRCTCGGRDLLLTQKEFSLLLQLAKNRGQYVPRERLYEMIWGRELLPTDTTLYTTVSRINKKLEGEKAGLMITSRRSQGYILEEI